MQIKVKSFDQIVKVNPDAAYGQEAWEAHYCGRIFEVEHSTYCQYEAYRIVDGGGIILAHECEVVEE